MIKKNYYDFLNMLAYLNIDDDGISIFLYD